MVDRDGHVIYLPVAFEFMAPGSAGVPCSPKPAELRIHDAADRPLDVTARQPDVAELTIVHLPKRFDRGLAIPMGDEHVGPNPEPADQSARHSLDCGLG
jgi:hypothetical protein